MSETEDDTRPFENATDEAVSALLDGELEGFAASHGLTPSEVQARLVAWSGFAERRDALAGIRSRLAELPALDEIARRRLVARALGEASDPEPPTMGPRDAPRHAPGRAWWLAGAAAILAIVVGIGLTVARTGPTSRSASSRSAFRAVVPRGDLGDLGDITSPSVLRARLTGSPPGASGAGRATGTTGASSAPSSGASAKARACAGVLAHRRSVVFTATGTYAGAAAIVIGIEDRGRTVVFVTRPSCSEVLASQSL